VTRTAREIVKVARALGMTCPDWIAIRRVHAGHWQRSAGAWSWYAVNANGLELFGSPDPAGEVIGAHKLEAVEMCDSSGSREIFINYKTLQES
jgi:hypothetical protein